MNYYEKKVVYLEVLDKPTAKKAKEIGFNWYTKYGYAKGNNADLQELHTFNENEIAISAPSLYLFQRFLREVHNIHISIKCNNTKDTVNTFEYQISKDNSIIQNTYGYVDYETALDEAISRSLDYLIQNIHKNEK